MNGPEVLVPLLLILLSSATISLLIYSRHRERMAMLEKGLSPEDIKALYERTGSRPRNPITALKWGMVLLCVGVSILLGIWLREVYIIDEGIFPALITLFGGIGLIAFYLVARRQSAE